METPLRRIKFGWEMAAATISAQVLDGVTDGLTTEENMGKSGCRYSAWWHKLSANPVVIGRDLSL